ncbi:MAG: galactokinase family protein [bacterium]
MNKGKNKVIVIEAPGRICLLGEHQDYLGLEVISGAMNLKVRLIARPAGNNAILKVNLILTNQIHCIDTSGAGTPQPRDYLRSGLNCMLSKGFHFKRGYTITVDGDLPIGKGVSSSSALCVGWIRLLAAIAENPCDLTAEQAALWAFETEVTRFNEPGGMQDHFASALGGLLHLDFNGRSNEPPSVTRLKPLPDGLLLVDSGQLKDTIGMISRIRSSVEKQFKRLCKDCCPSLSETTIDRVFSTGKKSLLFKELYGTLLNRDITRFAYHNWPSNPDHLPQFLAPLINAHHQYLSELIQSSSSAIDKCIEWCRRNGALAGKVIGSGGGGCLLIYAPGHALELKRKLTEQGYRVWDVRLGPGVTIS